MQVFSSSYVKLFVPSSAFIGNFKKKDDDFISNSRISWTATYIALSQSNLSNFVPVSNSCVFFKQCVMKTNTHSTGASRTIHKTSNDLFFGTTPQLSAPQLGFGRLYTMLPRPLKVLVSL